MQTLKLTKKHETYTEYKDSGIEWLGKIPTSWTLEKLKYVAPLVNKKVAKDNLQGIYVALENVESKTGKHIPSGQNVEPESMVNIFEDTDVLFGKLRPYLAKVFAPGFSGTATSEFLVLRPEKKISQKYLFYTILSQEFINTVNDSTYGAQMPRASWNFIGNLSVTLPSLKEQIQITNYLDKKIANLDKIIEKKQKQIDLLHEKRTAIINNAVTKGIDSGVEFIESDIDWIGKIPKGWKIEKMKFLAKAPLQYGANEAAFDDDITNPRFIRITDIDEKGNLKEETFKSLAKDIAKPYLLKDGDVLFARTGATVGKTFKYKKEWGTCCFAGYLIRMSVNTEKISSDYLKYITESDYYWKFVNSIFIKSTIQNVSAEKYKEFFIAFPSKSDQLKIVAYLNEKVLNYDRVLEHVEQSFGTLQEFKSSLISSVITGKVKV